MPEKVHVSIKHDHTQCKEQAKMLIDKSDGFILIIHNAEEKYLSTALCNPRDMTVPLSEALANEKILYLIIKSALAIADVIKEVQWTEPFVPEE